PVVTFYVLKDGGELYLIDTGFVSAQRLLRRALHRQGWDRLPVRGILLTHGHLDHALNAVPFARQFNAWIAGPRLDADHYLGKARNRGPGQVADILESIGRPLLRYRRFTPDRLLDSGDELPVWGGLRVVHLPGHTAGHCGFYCPRRKWLFSGDLFNSYTAFQIPPPDIFNSFPQQVPAAIASALTLDLAGVLPAHGDSSPPAIHLERLRRLNRSLAG
ncbi:MAG: MBL fold metallo-hydrolase, partial [Fimbriiglobus sp.]|nr:MBL fold metallo-hydrolase [Fimbriiglobus sp.]